MLFDSHIHFFPDKLRGKVFPKLAEISRGTYYTGESRQEALELLQEQGGTHCLALHIATNPAQMHSVNDFAAQSQGGNVLCFGSVHPAAADAVEELHRIKALGLRGVKFHPDYQDFMADAPEMDEIYRTCRDLGLPIAFHAGRDPYSQNLVHCTPAAIAKIAKDFPGLTIIAAHMGGMDMYEEVASSLAGTPGVYFDTAFATRCLTPQQLESLIKLHGVERIFFATDAPWSTISREKAFLEATGLSLEEKEQIYYKNAFKFFGIEQA